MDWSHEVWIPLAVEIIGAVIGGLILAWVIARGGVPKSREAANPKDTAPQRKIRVDILFEQSRLGRTSVHREKIAKGSTEDDNTHLFVRLVVLGAVTAFAYYSDAASFLLLALSSFTLILFATALIVLLALRIKLSKRSWLTFVSGVMGAGVGIVYSFLFSGIDIASQIQGGFSQFANVAYLLLGWTTCMILTIMSLWALLGVLAATISATSNRTRLGVSGNLFSGPCRPRGGSLCPLSS